MKKNYLLFILLFSNFLFSQTTSFHDTKGNIEVNGSGQLSYTLPIALPPGVKNVAPQVNLLYASGSSNGIAGYGWNISGVTSISRTSKTIEKDGEIAGVKLDNTDFFSFNGQRLLLKSGTGVYGGNGSEYVTEKYSNVKIKSLGAITGQNWIGPEYWEVTFEDGSQAWYGGLSSGASNARTPIEYNIVKWKDAQGNYILYNYSQTNNVALLSSVQWGGNETLNKPNFNEIIFDYNTTVTRFLKEISYVAGEKFVQDKILNSITVKTNNKQYRKYKINYTSNAENYQLVKDITEYNSNGETEAANPATFEYNTNQAVSEGVSFQYNPSNFNTKKYGDFNYDGITDYIEYLSGGTINYRNSVYLATTPIQLSYDTTKFNSAEFSSAKLITFKKNNIVKNKAGLVVPHKVPSSVSGKYDYELQVYSVDVNAQQLVFEYSKIVPYSKYYLFSDEDYSDCVNKPTALAELNAFDYNGDGISELILTFKGWSRCIVYNGNIKSQTIATPDIQDSLPLKTPLSKDNTEFSKETYNEQNNAEFQESNILPPPDGEYEWTYYSSLVLFDLDETKTSDESYSQFMSSNEPSIEYSFADFNGDGLQDLFELQGNKFSSVYNLKKNSNSIIKVNVGNFSTMPYSSLFYKALYGDFNGDGKADIMVPQADKTSNWHLYISNGKNFSQSSINNFIYFSGGNEVSGQGVHNNVFESGCDYYTLKYYQYNVGDLDADGKSEIIVTDVTIRDHEWNAHHDQEYTAVNTQVFSPTKTFSSSGSFNFSVTDTSGDIKFFRTRSWSPPTFYDKVIPFSALTLNHTNRQIILVGRPDDCGISNCDYNYVLQYNYQYLPELARLKKVTQAGLVTDAEYKELDPVVNPLIYSAVKQENYPFVEVEQINKSYVVSQIRQGNLKQDFRYRGMVTHLLGRGMVGFRKTARSSWYADGFENTKIWSGAEIDPLNEALPIKEWSIKTNDETQIFPGNLSVDTDISSGSTKLVSVKQTTYQTDILASGVKAIVPKTSTSKDFMKNVRTENTIDYGNYYLPSQTSTNINNGFSTSTTTLLYSSNIQGIGKDYYVGRPVSKTESMSVYGDTKSAKEEYTYNNNLLETLTKYNQNNTGWVREKYTYDEGNSSGFGNITKKEITNSKDVQTVVTKSQYDTSGKFVLKTTDNLGLETNLTYNDFGQVLTQVDPFNNTVTNVYDNWGKLVSSGSNLTGTATYLYEKVSVNGNIGTKITETSPDGNIKVSFTNNLGQNYKNLTKAFDQGKYVVRETSYDAMGRKVYESEPYFATSITEDATSPNSATWNHIVYDDNVFPTKVTVESFNNGRKIETSVSGRVTTVVEKNGYGRTYTKTTDDIGNLVSSLDPGGTITFAYNAAGQQVKATYGSNIVTTAYDEWGRKSSFNDPANGLYSYEYTGFGDIKKETSPKGYKQYSYKPNGLIENVVEKSNDGTSTDKNINFSYNTKFQLTGKSGTSNGKTYSTLYGYHTDGRVWGYTEYFENKEFRNWDTAYDSYGNVKSYKKEIVSGGITTSVLVENFYSSWDGSLYQVKQKDTGKILWELQSANPKGQVTSAKLGATQITNLYDSFGFLDTAKHISANANLMDMKYVFNAVKNELTERHHYNYGIDEYFTYDNNNRLTNWTNPKTGQPSSNTYDDQGRITVNDQLGNIGYNIGGNIYRASKMNLNANGLANYGIGGTNILLQNITYNENNDPVKIRGRQNDYAFGYGLTESRQVMNYGGKFEDSQNAQFTKYYSESGDAEVIFNRATGQEKHIIYIGGTPYESNIVFIKDFAESSGSFKFLHKDYLGTILAVSDETGNALERRHFDAWGILTHGTMNVIDRGYTSHEHLAGVGLIHMNGRLYDPLLRRFLNADENIQDPTNTQNYNKYGYVMNNPLMYNDPNGEFIFAIFAALPIFWGTVATAAVIGAAIGAIMYSVQAAITGNWSWGGFAKSVFMGAFTGAVSAGLGQVFSAGGFWASVGNGALAGAGSGGITSIINGQNFFAGLLKGAVIGGIIGGVTWKIGQMVNAKNDIQLNADGKISYDGQQFANKEELISYIKANNGNVNTIMNKLKISNIELASETNLPSASEGKSLTFEKGFMYEYKKDFMGNLSDKTQVLAKTVRENGYSKIFVSPGLKGVHIDGHYLAKAFINHEFIHSYHLMKGLTNTTYLESSAWSYNYAYAKYYNLALTDFRNNVMRFGFNMPVSYKWSSSGINNFIKLF